MRVKRYKIDIDQDALNILKEVEKELELELDNRVSYSSAIRHLKRK